MMASSEHSEAARSEHEQLQQAHYDRIIEHYESHYDDPCSQTYRRRFIYDPMFEGIDFKGFNVLEGMCGSGQVTGFLEAKGAKVTGLDLSPHAIELFRKNWPGTDAIVASIRDTKLPSESFDCVIVMGGLHHICPYLDEAVQEIHRLLKVGGYFCFGEPHTGSFPDFVRRIWYRFDRKMFAEGEEAIDIEAMKARHSTSFKCLKQRYLGTVAYLFIMNSMILRIPLWTKRYYSPVLSVIESCTRFLEFRGTTCFSISQWQKVGPTEHRIV